MDRTSLIKQETLIVRVALALGAAVFFIAPTLDAMAFVIAGAGVAAMLMRWYVMGYAPIPRNLYTVILSLTIVGGVIFAPNSEDYTVEMVLAVGLLVFGYVLPLSARPDLTAMPGSDAPSAGSSTRMDYQPSSTLMDNDLTTHIGVTVDGMIRSAEAVKEVVKQQSTGAKEQAAVINLTNVQIDEFIHLSHSTTERTQELTARMEEATTISAEGQQALQQVLLGMGQIRQQVSVIASTAVQLAQLTRRIDRIITSVGEIATQSNLLALNASIEAARAGEQGRGFAVVADEVRELAKQSTEAASQVRAILGEVQSSVKETVTATEIGMSQVDSGLDEAQSAHATMAHLNTSVQESFGSIKNVSQIIRQQAQGMDEIALNMDRINSITEQTLVSTQLAEQVSQQLSGMARDLQRAARLDMESHPTM